MTKVLVTGSSGFVGTAVVQELQRRDFEVLGFERINKHNDKQRDYEVFYGDIRDRDAVHDAVSHSNAFLNLAGLLGTQELIVNPLPALETNVLGAGYVMQAAAHYGVPGVQIAVGNHWMNNPYSITKSTAERLAAMYREFRDLDISVVRGLNIYGPGQSIARPYGDSSVRKFLPSFVCRALVNDPIEVYGDGTSIMDIIYKTDFARIFVSALEYTIDNGGYDGIFDAGSGVETTVNDIVHTVIKHAGSGEVTYKPMRPGEDKHSVVLADVNSLSPLAEYGIDPLEFIDFDTGIEKTVEAFRNDWLPGYTKHNAH